MYQSDNVDAQLQRLLKIDWYQWNQPQGSHVLLLREYVRRMAFWAIALERPDRWPHWVLFDVAEEIAPIEGYIGQQLAQLRQHLDAQHLNAHNVPLLARRICVWSLNWAALPASQISQYSLLEPYEPLVIMFERGGTQLRYDHGFLEVNLASLSPLNISIYERAVETPVISLDNDTLDEIDKTPYWE